MSYEPVKLNAIERAIGTISPSWGARRISAKLRYEAAQRTRFRDFAGPVGGSESTRDGMDRVNLISEARDLEQNFAPFAHIGDLFSLYTLPRLTYQARTGDTDLDNSIEAEWRRWCQDCDISGRHDLLTLLRLALRSRKRDGDHALILVDTEDGLKVWPVEADRIGDPNNTTISETYISGITIDPATGKPLSYRIYNRTRTGAYTDPQEVDADRVLLLINPKRTDQYRGRSEYASFINTARDYKEVMESLRIGIKYEAMHGGVIHSDSPDLDSTSEWASGGAAQTVNGAPVESLQPGKLVRVGTNEKVDFLSNSRPSTAFQGYMSTLIEEMAAGANLPPGFLWTTLFGKGPGVRMESQMALRTFQAEQQLLVSQVLDKLKNRVILRGILAGRIRSAIVPSSTTDPYHGHWSFGRWVTIDAGRDSRAMIDEFRAGLRTLQSIADEQGEDWEEILAENIRVKVRARKMAQDAGVEILDQQLLTVGGQVPTEQIAGNSATS
jgi:capsid protein